MSWIDRENTELIIKTGDGKEYKPQYLNAEKEVQYNTTNFEFVNRRGTLVYRGKDKGAIYSLELYFQGEDNIEQSSAFEISARDSRPWEISHPLYDSIFVQPVTLRIDNTRQNVSKITAQVIETITNKLPKSTIDPEDKIVQNQATLNEAIATEFAAENITTLEVTEITANNETLFEKGKNLAGNATDAYYNAFKTANSAVAQATAFPLNAMRSVQTFISAPARFAESVQDRVNLLLQQAQSLRLKLTNLVTRGDKVVYEATVAGLTGSVAVASVTNPEYTSVTQTIGIVTSLSNLMSQFLEDLDTLQSDTGGDVGYIPNAEVIGRLDALVNFTIAHLKEVALSQRAEHSVILEQDSNLLLLAHRFYGLDPDDENLNELTNINELGLNEMLGIRKGRLIKYYV